MYLDLDGSALISFGFRRLGNSTDEDENSLFTAFNVLNIAGYLPLAGIISGVYRLALGREGLKTQDNEARTFGKVMIARGILECLGVGAVLAPADVGCTAARLVRDCIHKKNASHVKTS